MRKIVFNHAGVRELIQRLAHVECLPDAPCIGVLKDGKPYGGVLYTTYTTASIQIHMAGMSEDWVSRELLLLAFDYPFNQLGVTKLIGPTPSTNLLALRANFRLGFRIEAVIEDALPDGHLYILTMRRAECRWLKHPLRGFTRGVKEAA